MNKIKQNDIIIVLHIMGYGRGQVSTVDRDTGHCLCDLVPCRHMTAEWRSKNDNIHVHLIQWIVVEYGSSHS